MTLAAVLAFPTSAPVESPRSVYLGTLAPGSRPAMESAIAKIDKIAPAPEHAPMDARRARRVREALVSAEIAPSYANRVLSAVRGLVKASFALGLIDAEERARAMDAIPYVRGGDSKAAGRNVPESESDRCFASAADGSAIGARDALALGLLFDLGLRRAEVAGLQLADVGPHPLDGTPCITVTGKRGKVRRVPLAGRVPELLSAWVALRGEAPGPLLTRVTRGDRVTPDAISGAAVAEIIARRGGDFRAHDARRTLATELVAEHGLGLAAQILGHSDVSTTRRYDMSEETRAHAALRALTSARGNAAK